MRNVILAAVLLVAVCPVARAESLDGALMPRVLFPNELKPATIEAEARKQQDLENKLMRRIAEQLRRLERGMPVPRRLHCE